MAFEEVTKKFLSNKRKQVVSWDESTGNLKVVVLSADGKVEKEVLKEAKS